MDALSSSTGTKRTTTHSRYLVPYMVDHGMRVDNLNALPALVLAP